MKSKDECKFDLTTWLVYIASMLYKVIDFAVYLEIKIAYTKEKLIQFFRQDNFEFSFMVVRALVKNCMRVFFFFSFSSSICRERAIRGDNPVFR